MKICKQCQQNYPDHAKYCSQCGKKLELIEEEQADKIERNKDYQLMEPVLAHPGRQSFTVVAADGSISLACIHSWRFSAIALVQQQK